jgi:hypothetical protein
MLDLEPRDDTVDRSSKRCQVARPSRPRWVTALGVLALVLIVILLVMALVGGGEHGPDRHTSSLDVTRTTPDVPGGAYGRTGRAGGLEPS